LAPFLRSLALSKKVANYFGPQSNALNVKKYELIASSKHGRF
jgi:hypothetical protein